MTDITEIFPTAAVFDGTLKTVPFDESQAWADILLGVLISELTAHADHLDDFHGSNFRQTSAFERWLKHADNFFEFLLENYRPETVVMVAKYLIAERRLPFDTTRMTTFDRMANHVAKTLVAAG